MAIVTRINTIQCAFDRSHARPSALEVHSWVKTELKVAVEDVVGLQLDFLQNSLFLKLTNGDLCEALVAENNGSRQFKHSDGTISTVTVSHAGYGIRTLRIFSLPFECDNEMLRKSLSAYGKVFTVMQDPWGGNFEYAVNSGVRSVRMELQRHIPSFLQVGGHRAFVSYAGQPQTCSICNSPDHLRNNCNKRRPAQLPRTAAESGDNTYAGVAQRLLSSWRRPNAPPPAPAVPTTTSSSVETVVVFDMPDSHKDITPEAGFRQVVEAEIHTPPIEATAAQLTMETDVPAPPRKIAMNLSDSDEARNMISTPEVPASEAFPSLAASKPSDPPRTRELREKRRQVSSASQSDVDLPQCSDSDVEPQAKPPRPVSRKSRQKLRRSLDGRAAPTPAVSPIVSAEIHPPDVNTSPSESPRQPRYENAEGVFAMGPPGDKETPLSWTDDPMADD